MIFIDLDSTLNNFIESAVFRLNKEYGKNYSVKDIKHWNHVLELYPDSAFLKLFQKDVYEYLNVQLFNDAKALLGVLNCYDSVVILTDTSEEMKISKLKWCSKAGLENLVEDIIFTNQTNKKEHYIKQDDILIDDKFETIYNVVKNNKAFGLLYRHYDKYRYNDFIYDNWRFRRCNTYQDIVDNVEKIYKRKAK